MKKRRRHWISESQLQHSRRTIVSTSRRLTRSDQRFQESVAMFPTFVKLFSRSDSSIEIALFLTALVFELFREELAHSAHLI